MLNDIISVKHKIVFKRKKENSVDLNKKKDRKTKGGSQILGWMYARGKGGVIQMRTVCNRGSGGRV